MLCALLAGRGSKLAARGDAPELHPRQRRKRICFSTALLAGGPKREQWARGAGRQPGYYARLLEAEGFDLAAREDAPEQRMRQEFTRVRYRVNRLTATSLSWHGARLARRLCRALLPHVNQLIAGNASGSPRILKSGLLGEFNSKQEAGVSVLVLLCDHS